MQAGVLQACCFKHAISSSLFPSHSGGSGLRLVDWTVWLSSLQWNRLNICIGLSQGNKNSAHVLAAQYFFSLLPSRIFMLPRESIDSLADPHASYA